MLYNVFVNILPYDIYFNIAEKEIILLKVLSLYQHNQ